METVAGVIFVHDLSNIRSEQNLANWVDIFYTYRMQNMQANLNSTRNGSFSTDFTSPNVSLLGDVERCGTLPTLIVGKET